MGAVTALQTTATPVNDVHINDMIVIEDKNAETMGQEVQSCRFELDNCFRDDIAFLEEQSAHPEITIGDINGRLTSTLANSMRSSKVVYAHGMKTLYPIGAKDDDALSISLIFDNKEGNKILTEGMKMILFDGLHHLQVFATLEEEQGEHRWARGKMNFIQIQHYDGFVILPAEAIELSKMSNQSAASVRGDLSFVSMISSLCHYARGFEPKHGVCFGKARSEDVIHCFMSAVFLETASSAIYMRCVRVANGLMRIAEPLLLRRG